jgi:uncharacterized membrane protein YkvA (DUF1232 family)
VSIWLAVVGVLVLSYALIVALLAVVGRNVDARAAARIVPHSVIVCKRLITDGRVPLRHKLLLAGLIGYLAVPFDLVPDFIPVVGLLDDALVAALVLRMLLSGSSRDLIREHWPGAEPLPRVI